ncbi:hypothetical protein EYR36_000845 [Pleurotus pulmonarius]|nr:hypothetical protein EYR36_000845 [Pleurotus pulmonarius]
MAVEPLLATRAQRAFILTISIQAIVVLVMVAITFRLVEVEVDFDNGYKTLPCFLALFALAEIFELIMAFDALRLRNIIQLIGILGTAPQLTSKLPASHAVEQTRLALVIGQNCVDNWNSVTCDGPGSLWRRVQSYLIVAPCVIGVSWAVMLFFVKQLYAEFGWAIFHVVGANPKMKAMYQWYQIMICLLKFDFFCFTGVTMQLLIIVLARDSAEFGVTIAAIPVVLFLLAACGYAVQREIKWLMSLSLVIMLAAMSYLSTNCDSPSEHWSHLFGPVYKLVRFFQPSSRDQYATTRVSLTIFTIVAFLILFASFVVGLRCFSDFDQGLDSSKMHDWQTNLVVTGLSAVFLLYTRSAGVLYFTLGALLCSATVKLIKRAIRQPRPVVEHAVGKRKVSYGMPSTHSATIIYYATYIPLACAKLPIHPSLPANTVITRVLPVLIAVPYGYVIAASRVWLGHHTWKQVVVGGSYGAALAAVWFELWVRGGNAYGQALERDVHGYVVQFFGRA